MSSLTADSSSIGSRSTYLSVRVKSGRFVSGLVIAISVDQVQLAFQDGATSTFAVGAQVEISFQDGPKAMMVTGAVTKRVERATDRSYSIRFIVDDEEKKRLAGVIGRVHNVRAHHRTTPGKAPCSAGIRVDERHAWSDCVLLDFSENGVTLRLPAGVEADELALARFVEIKLGLPVDKNPILVFGSIVNRTLIDSSIRYGIRFDPDRTSDLGAVRSALSRYAATRQQEDLAQQAWKLARPTAR